MGCTNLCELCQTSRHLLVQLPARHWFFFIFLSHFFSCFRSLHVPRLGTSLETPEAQLPSGYWPSFFSFSLPSSSLALGPQPEERRRDPTVCLPYQLLARPQRSRARDAGFFSPPHLIGRPSESHRHVVEKDKQSTARLPSFIEKRLVWKLFSQPHSRTTLETNLLIQPAKIGQKKSNL